MNWKIFLQILGVVVPTASAWILFHQIRLQRKEINIRFDYQKKEKAIEMSQVFADSIKESNYLISVIEEFEIFKMIDYVDYNKLEHFDFDEFVDIFKCNPAQYAVNVQLETVSVEKLEKKYKLFKNFELPLDNLDDENKIRTFLENEFYKDLYDYLNKMESFSMNFCLNLADNECVYRSLHQLFLLNIKALYFHIAITNNSGIKDKYYCNIINLYNKWAAQYAFEVKREEKERQEKEKEKLQRNRLDKIKKREETIIKSDDYKI